MLKGKNAPRTENKLDAFFEKDAPVADNTLKLSAEALSVKPVKPTRGKIVDQSNKVKLFRGDRLIASAISARDAMEFCKNDNTLRYE